MESVLRAMGEGEFAGIPAPSGIGEPFVPRVVSYDVRPQGSPRAKGLLRLIGAERRQRQAREYRRTVMGEARTREQKRREAIRRASVLTPQTPLQALRADIERGGFVRFTEQVRERVYLRDASGIVRGTFQLDAPGYLVQLERLYSDYSATVRGTVALMRDDGASNEGRGAIAVHAASSVNGTETRVSERWTQTRPRDVLGKDGEPIDRTCYRVMPDGSRVPLVSTVTAKRRKASAAVEPARLRIDHRYRSVRQHSPTSN